MRLTREQVMLRTRFGWPAGTVPFSKTAFFNAKDSTITENSRSGYRCDAAGFVSMAWGIPLFAPHSFGGMSVVTLLTDGWCYEIKGTDLKPGDAVGQLGPNTMDADGGVVGIFEGWLNDDMSHGYALVWEILPGSSPGPQRKGRVFDFRWHAYRFKDIVD